MPGNAPFTYNIANEIIGSASPNYTHIDGALSRFFKRYLLQTAMSTFKWNLPDLWEKNYFLYSLYGFGYLAVINTDKFGVIPQHCGLGGYTVFYQPAYALVTNPRLPLNKTRYDIGTECELIRLQPDYCGVMDLVNYYGDMMALCAESIATNLTNTKLAYVFAADHKGAAETFKKLVDSVTSGNPAIAVDKALFDDKGNPRWTTFAQNLQQNYIADKLQSQLDMYQTEFMRAIGIPAVGQEKKERLITDEVNVGNSECKTRADMWLENLKQSCDKVNAMFGINIGVDWRYDPDEGSETDNAGEDISTGSV